MDWRLSGPGNLRTNPEGGPAGQSSDLAAPLTADKKELPVRLPNTRRSRNEYLENGVLRPGALLMFCRKDIWSGIPDGTGSGF